ncbi:MAG TPA: hypothetical protein VN632_10460 [Stellaceae bacterium]|nr:hypothetical protein [Stellaceae bacterium]
MLNYLLARAKEPSSYAGLAGLLGMAGVTLAPDEWQAIVGVLTAGASLLAIILPEFGIGSAS